MNPLLMMLLGLSIWFALGPLGFAAAVGFVTGQYIRWRQEMGRGALPSQLVRSLREDAVAIGAGLLAALGTMGLLIICVRVLLTLVAHTF